MAGLAALRVLAAALALLCFAAAPAGAQDGVRRAAQALAADPVYVDPSAELAGEVDAAALRARIRSAHAAPMFVAVLPASAVQGSAGRTLIALREAVGREGTYALAAGEQFRTLSDAFDAAGPGDDARAAHPDDLQAALVAFIDRAGQERGDSGRGAGAIVTVAILVLVAIGGAALLVSRRRARTDGRSEVGEVDQRADFVRLGDAIRALELDITLGEGGAAAKADYDRAVTAYERANELDRQGAETAANEALDRGLEAIASARERLAGRR
jgi:hypothetical protein